MSEDSISAKSRLSRGRAWALLAGVLAIVTLAVTARPVSHQFAGWRARAHYPRVVLVTFDTLNVWYTDLFSPGAATTPHLDALAAEGVLFEHAYTPVPLTLPSHTSLLTGHSPMATGVLSNDGHVPDEVVTLQEILAQHDYSTAAFLALGVLNARANLAQGFDHYDDLNAHRLGRFFRTADEVLEPTADWLEAHGDEPFFLWVHLSDPHAPYLDPEAPPNVEVRLDGKPVARRTVAQHVRHPVEIELAPGHHTLTWTSVRPPREGDLPGTVPAIELLGPDVIASWIVDPPPDFGAERVLRTPWTLELENPYTRSVNLPITFTGRIIDRPEAQILRDYRTEVTYADRYLGKLRHLLETRDLERDTLWLIASDHGEGLFAHGSGGHALHNWEEQLRTVLLIKGPGVPAGRRIAEPAVLNQDAFASVLDLLGLPIPSDVDSASLVPCWTDDRCGRPRQEWVAYGLSRERTLSSASVYQWPLKAIAPSKGRGGVFNLLDDPREQRPVLGLEERADRSVPTAVHTIRRKLSQTIPPLRHLLEAAASGEIAPEDREMLEALGYL